MALFDALGRAHTAPPAFDEREHAPRPSVPLPRLCGLRLRGTSKSRQKSAHRFPAAAAGAAIVDFARSGNCSLPALRYHRRAQNPPPRAEPSSNCMRTRQANLRRGWQEFSGWPAGYVSLGSSRVSRFAPEKTAAAVLLHVPGLGRFPRKTAARLAAAKHFVRYLSSTSRSYSNLPRPTATSLRFFFPPPRKQPDSSSRRIGLKWNVFTPQSTACSSEPAKPTQPQLRETCGCFTPTPLLKTQVRHHQGVGLRTHRSDRIFGSSGLLWSSQGRSDLVGWCTGHCLNWTENVVLPPAFRKQVTVEARPLGRASHSRKFRWDRFIGGRPQGLRHGAGSPVADGPVCAMWLADSSARSSENPPWPSTKIFRTMQFGARSGS